MKDLAQDQDFFITIEKQILADYATGISMELVELADAVRTHEQQQAIRNIALYCKKLAALTELGEGK